MIKNIFSHYRLSRLMRRIESALMIRLGLSYFVFLALFFGIQSAWLSRLVGYPFTRPVGFDHFALLLPVLGIAIFLFVERPFLLSSTPLRWPSPIGYGVRILAMIGIVILSVWITHPSDHQYELIVLFMKTYDPIGKQIVATGLYASLFLPLIPSLILLLPTDCIFRHFTALLAGLFFLFFYIFVHPLEVLYHFATGPLILRAVSYLLHHLPGDTVLSPERWEIQYRTFSIILGPLCSGFTALALFVAIFCILWWLLQRRTGIYHLRALMVLLLGVVTLFVVNILRIALIVIVGSFSRTLGITLFHSTAGSLFFFLIIVVTIRKVLPMLQRKNQKHTHHQRSKHHTDLIPHTRDRPL